MRLPSCLLLPVAACAQAVPLAKLEIHNLDAAVVTYQGREATRLVDRAGCGLALLKNSVFRNGTIEAELAGKPSAGSGEQRGEMGRMHFEAGSVGGDVRSVPVI